MRFAFLVLLFISVFTADAQVEASKTAESPLPKYKLKLSIFDQSYFSLPTIKIHGEMRLTKSANPLYGQIDLGYNFNSQDEMISARGYYTGLRLNNYLPIVFRYQTVISYGFFYQRSYLNNYLKVSKILPGLGEYSEYEKMDFQKERYGFTIDLQKHIPLFDRIFFEYGFSGGIMFMQTITPDRVTQYTFVNGTYKEKKVVTPAIGFSLKIGYLL